MAKEPQPALEDLIATGVLNALDSVVELDLFGVSGGKAVISGTWSGTIKFEGMIDFDRWDPIGTFSGTTGAILSQTGTTVNDAIVFVGIAGLKKIRARMHVYNSGSADVTLRSSNGVSNIFADNLIPGNFKVEAYGKTAVGATPTENGVLISGIDRSGLKQNLPVFKTHSERKGFSFSSAQTNTVVWTPAAGKRVYVSGYILTCSGTVDTVCQIFFGTNSADNWIFNGKLDVSINSPILANTPIQPPTRGNVDEALKITNDASAILSGVIYGFEDV